MISDKSHMLIVSALESAFVKVEAALRDQISIRDSRIANLEEELAQAKAKIERMEIAMLPLSSAAGAVYVAGPAPRPERKLAPIKRESEMSWPEYLAKYMKETEEAEKQARALQSSQNT